MKRKMREVRERTEVGKVSLVATDDVSEVRHGNGKW